MARITGTVKWFSDAKGYGFIEREGGDDVFVHHSGIDGHGYTSLAEGEKVELEVVQDEKGPRAQHVVRLDPPSGTTGTSEQPVQSPTDHTRY